LTCRWRVSSKASSLKHWPSFELCFISDVAIMNKTNTTEAPIWLNSKMTHMDPTFSC
jgi:hypothetical protein